MAGKSVGLSTADATAPDHYHFLVRVALARKDGGTLASDYLIERDGDEVGVLVRSADGLPFAYATNGLFVGIDPKEPGRLVTFTGGSPTFAYEARADGSGLVFELSYVKDATKPSVVFDARSLLAAALERAVDAKVAPDGRSVELKTVKATITVVAALPEKTAAFAVERLTTTTTASGAAITVTDIHVERTLCVNVLGVTRDSVRKLGLPIRELADADHGPCSSSRPTSARTGGSGTRPRSSRPCSAQALRPNPLMRAGGSPQNSFEGTRCARSLLSRPSGPEKEVSR